MSYYGGDSVVKVEKKLRLCPLQDVRKVVCDGLCKVVFDNSAVHMCPVFVEAFDDAANCQ
jgi:hypothetical protein